MAARSKYKIAVMKANFINFLGILAGENLLEGYSKEIVYTWFKETQIHGERIHSIEINPARPLKFSPIVDYSIPIQADISTECIRRGDGCRDLNSHCLLIRLWERPEDGESRVICRSHIDLANPEQKAPWSHIQFGGETIDDGEKWKPPPETGAIRWPSALFDLVLACELLVSSFWPKKWEELCKKPEFVDPIRKSEEAYVQPFFEAWSCYSRRRNSNKSTFLTALWNTISSHPWTP
jgi:hypothetical protein